MIILGIETSCDETSIAALNINQRNLKLLAFNISSQVELHAPYSGVVPELAARRHAEIIIPLLHQTLHQAKLTSKKINAIAVTSGPGLITALQVGVETAKILAAIWRKPLIPVNHIAGHLVSPFLSTSLAPWLRSNYTGWPAVALVVSGGHTEIHLMKSIRHQQLLGRTLDDAAGEAFDKVAKMLNLPYPGGPQVAKLATQGNSKAFNLPRPMMNSKNYNFSFAGLKTAVLYTLLNKVKSPHTIPPRQEAVGKQKSPHYPAKAGGSGQAKVKADVCASFQQATIDVLIAKTMRAAIDYKAKTIIVAGGVSANKELKQQFITASKSAPAIRYMLFPDSAFAGDNAAMIALAGYIISNQGKSLNQYQSSWKNLTAQANWELWN